MSDVRKHVWWIPETWLAAVTAVCIAAVAALTPLIGLSAAVSIVGSAYLVILVALLVCRKADPRQVIADERDRKISHSAERLAGTVVFLVAAMSSMAVSIAFMAQGRETLTLPLEAPLAAVLIGLYLFVFVKAVAVLVLHARERGHGQD